MFERPYHQRIAHVLTSLDAELVRQLGCWFAGGTAIALRLGEFRESLDIDFLVSDADCYRNLRERLRGATSLAPLTRPGLQPFPFLRELRIDQYGIRGFIDLTPTPIKIEFVRESRIDLRSPRRHVNVCGIASPSWCELAVTKLLANSDRWRDDSTFSRDAIDLAFMPLPPRVLAPAVQAATKVYGVQAETDLLRAIEALRGRAGWLARCIAALSISEPTASVVQRLRLLHRRVAPASHTR